MVYFNGNIFYEEGDRVELIRNNPDNNEDLHAGDTGTVVEDLGFDEKSNSWICVRWDHEIERGHDTGNPDLCPHGYGWNVDRKDIIPSQDSTVDDAKTEYDLATEDELLSLLDA